MTGDIVAMVSALLLGAPAFGALYARPARSDGRVAVAVGALALLTIATCIAAERWWPEPQVGFQLVIFTRAELASQLAAAGFRVEVATGRAVVFLRARRP